MARKQRLFSRDVVYHAINLASAHARILHMDADDAAFENTRHTLQRTSSQILRPTRATAFSPTKG